MTEERDAGFYEGTPQVESTQETTTIEQTAETQPVATENTDQPGAETTTTGQETKPATEQPESFFDKFVPKNSETQATNEEVKPPAVDFEKENKELKDKVAAFEAAEKAKANTETLLEKILGGKKDLTGVDLKQLFKEAAGEDYSHMSDKDLIEKNLRSNPNFSKLTEDEQKDIIERELSNYEDMDKLRKLDLRESLLAKLNKSGEDSELFKALKEQQDAQRNNIADPDKYFEDRYKQETQAAHDIINPQLNEMANSIVGRKEFGFDITPDHAKKMMEMHNNDITNFTAEGRVMQLFYAATYEDYGKSMYEKGKRDATVKGANPSQNLSTPVISTKEANEPKRDVNFYSNQPN